MCCDLLIGSTGWRNMPLVVTMSRARRLARRSRRHTQTKWHILLRQTEQHPCPVSRVCESPLSRNHT
jgi:hypothetical protein